MALTPYKVRKYRAANATFQGIFMELLTRTALSPVRRSRRKALVLESVLTCPACGHAKAERMPIDACQWFYECEACTTLLRPKPGDCCVFCSYGTQRCPPAQIGSTAACCPAVTAPS
jgi:hypothetical protein